MHFWNYSADARSSDKHKKNHVETVFNVQKINLPNDGKKEDPSDNKNEGILGRLDVDQPMWSQDNYLGRWRHFAFVTDVRTIFARDETLYEAKKLCELYKRGKEPAGTTRSEIVWAKKLKDSSFHPDNGELMNLIGRMSFQLPGNVFLTTGMLTFYKTARATITWQVMNQAFNATVNYTNRNAAGATETEGTEKIKQAFHAATLTSCAAALGFRKFLSSRGTLAARWAPFFAVAVGNMTNLPIMRQFEIERGIPVFTIDNDETPIMSSRVAAVKAIGECVTSRIAMAAPGMLITPVFMKRHEAYCFYQRRPWIGSVIEISMVGVFLVFMIPTALAIYPQRNSMNTELLRLRMTEYEEYQRKGQTSGPSFLYYNKGL